MGLGTGEAQFQRARLLVGALVQAGVRRAVTSPGSRSTPLVLAALDAAAAGLEVASVVDERAAGFFALGQARATGAPTVLICTSGTAPAHYLPAMMEAREAGVPLIALTADRPIELMDCAAPQTTDQTKLFGAVVNHFAEVDLAGPVDPLSLRALRRTAAQAVFRSRWPRPGAVHLNARARKPLEPEAGPWVRGSAVRAPDDRRTDPFTGGAERATRVADPLPPRAARNPVAVDGSLAAAVDALLDEPIKAAVPAAQPDPAALDRAAALCRQAERGLIVAGPLPLPPPERRRRGGHVHGLADLANRSGFPMVAEATSQSRFVKPDGTATIEHSGSGGGHGEVSADLTAAEVPGGVGHVADCLGAAWLPGEEGTPPGPDLVLQVGAAPVSAGLQRLLETCAAPRIVISDGPWTDPDGLATVFLPGDVPAAVAGLGSRLEATPVKPAGEAWRRDVLTLARRFREAAADVAADSGGRFHDGEAARAAVEAMPAGGLLMLGNSLPVRLVEDWIGRVERRIWIASQRGLSGIDGLVAGFLGSLSTGGFPAGVLLLGDVSLLHDLDGLAIAPEYGDGPPAVIVAIDNGGGRIFDRLPIAKTDVFRGLAGRHWLTPHGVDFGALARAFGVPHSRVEDASALGQETAAALDRRGVSLIVAEVAAGALAAAEESLRRTTRALSSR